MAKKQVVWGKVTIELKGRTIEGHYGDDGRVVIVRYGGDSKATQLGSSPPVTIAGGHISQPIRRRNRLSLDHVLQLG